MLLGRECPFVDLINHYSYTTTSIQRYVDVVKTLKGRLKNVVLMAECIIPNWSKLWKKQCGGVHFCANSIAFGMPIQQKLTPPVLLYQSVKKSKITYVQIS